MKRLSKDQLLNREVSKAYPSLHWRSNFFKRMKETPKPDMKTDSLKKATNYFADYINVEKDYIFSSLYKAIRNLKKENFMSNYVPFGLSAGLLEIIIKDDKILLFYPIPKTKGGESVLIEMPLGNQNREKE